MSDDLAALAADAYVYGFPLIFDLHAVGGHIEMGLLAPAPFNKFSHACLFIEIMTVCCRDDL